MQGEHCRESLPLCLSTPPWLNFPPGHIWQPLPSIFHPGGQVHMEGEGVAERLLEGVLEGEAPLERVGEGLGVVERVPVAEAERVGVEVRVCVAVGVAVGVPVGELLWLGVVEGVGEGVEEGVFEGLLVGEVVGVVEAVLVAVLVVEGLSRGRRLPMGESLGVVEREGEAVGVGVGVGDLEGDAVEVGLVDTVVLGVPVEGPVGVGV